MRYNVGHTCIDHIPVMLQGERGSEPEVHEASGGDPGVDAAAGRTVGVLLQVCRHPPGLHAQVRFHLHCLYSDITYIVLRKVFVFCCPFLRPDM